MSERSPGSRPSLPPPLTPLDLPEGQKPTPEAIAGHLARAGVTASRWSNGPGDRYAAHLHTYTKLLMCAAGSITFLVGADRVPVALGAGQGFVLPANVQHAAVVGPMGCTCLEGHRD